MPAFLMQATHDIISAIILSTYYFIYLLFLFFLHSLIKPVFSDLARSSRSPLDIQKLDFTNNIKLKAVHEFKRNICYSYLLWVEMKVI